MSVKKMDRTLVSENEYSDLVEKNTLLLEEIIKKEKNKKIKRALTEELSQFGEDAYNEVYDVNGDFDQTRATRKAKTLSGISLQAEAKRIEELNKASINSRVATGVAYGLSVSAATTYISTIGERTGDNLAEKKARQSFAIGTKVVGLISSFAVAGGVGFSTALIGMAVSEITSNYSYNVSLNKERKVTEYNQSVKGPMSYDGSR